MNVKVMLVDDDKVILFLHKILVEGSKLPSEPLIFSNATEAFSFLKNPIPSNEVFFILLDLNMPGMDGWEFLEEISKLEVKNKIYVCVVTSSVNHKDKLKAFQYEQVIDFVEKPLNFLVCNQLFEKLQNNLKDGSF